MSPSSSKSIGAIPSIFLVLAMGSVALNPPLQPEKNSNTPSYRISSVLINDLSLGYRNLLSQLYWIKTIAYFGEHLDKADFHFLAQLLDTVTSLNPKAEHAYYMAAVVLPWHTSSTKYSAHLLDRAMLAMPLDWRWPYYQGFNAYWFDKNLEAAQRLLKKAASLPGAPVIVAHIAARIHSGTSQLDTALSFLVDLARRKQDKAIRKALESQIEQIRTEIAIRKLEALLQRLDIHPSSMADLRKSGLSLPSKLPDGGQLMMVDGTLVSSKTRKRFVIYRPPHMATPGQGGSVANHP
ncbi:MAG: hypothetical protein D6698_02915 [Gammaproteobacteria bacterium]|nr:MAG: hypothetical protein D6698_02915 [Gammaproteobacteria bacterium]